MRYKVNREMRDLGVESLSAENTGITDTNGEAQVEIVGIGPDNSLNDLEGTREEGILFRMSDEADGAGGGDGHVRVMISEDTPLGAYGHDPDGSGPYATELIKLFNGMVQLENDRPDGPVELKSSQGGEVNLKTEESSSIGDVLRRLSITGSEHATEPPEIAIWRNLNRVHHRSVPSTWGPNDLRQLEISASDFGAVTTIGPEAAEWGIYSDDGTTKDKLMSLTDSVYFDAEPIVRASEGLELNSNPLKGVKNYQNASAGDLANGELAIDTDRSGTGTTSLLWKNPDTFSVRYIDFDGTL